MAARLKKGDKVLVLSGREKGKSGEILKVLPKRNRVIVQGINLVKRHTRPSGGTAGGIIEKEMPIHISNLSYYDSKLKKGVRIGIKFSDKGKKIRFNKQTQKEI